MAKVYPEAMPPPNMAWARFRLIFAIGLLVVSVGSWYLLSRISPDYPIGPTDVSVLSLKELYPEAIEVAQGWLGDAYLVYADVTILPIEDAETLRASYSFRSQQADQSWLNVYIRMKASGIEVRSEDGVFGISRPAEGPIDLDKVLDSTEALEIIQEEGGGDFYLENSGLTWPQDLYLEHQDRTNFSGALVWRGSYMNPVTHDRLSVVIDAKSGDLLYTNDFEDQ